jgi:hypothetical protein
MTFHYFEPNVEQYLSTTVEVMHVSVSGMRPGNRMMEDDQVEDISQFVSALPPVQAVNNRAEEVPITPWLFRLLLVFPPLGWLFLLCAGRVQLWHTRRQPVLELKGAWSTAKREIIRCSEGPEGEALEGVYNALSHYIKVRLGVSSTAFTADNLCEEMVNRGLKRPLSESTVVLFNQIENERFAGAETRKNFISEVSSRALSLLDEMEEQF